MDNKRLASIDTLRFLAIWGVLVIHAPYFFGSSDKDITGWVKILFWLSNKASFFSVPFFFIVSGYFFGKAYLKEKNITRVYLKHIQRLLIIFIGWSFIYSIFSFNPFSADQWHVIKQYGLAHAYYRHFQVSYLENPVLLLMMGTSGHLWFISALMQSLTLILLFIFLKQEKFLIYFGLLAYFLVPVVKTYVHPPPGPSFNYNFNPLVEVLTSTLPVTMGWWLSKKKEYKRSTALLLLIIGILLACFQFTNNSYALKIGYLESYSLLIPFSLFMFALLSPEWSANTVLPNLGRMTLGIYCIHPSIMFYLGVFKGMKNHYLWDIPLLLLTYLISLFIVLILKANPLTRKLVV